MFKTLTHFLSLTILLLSNRAVGQTDLQYFLPENVTYDTVIPKPEEVIGHHVGEWHVTHEKLIRYMSILDERSDRISLRTIGYTHERKPLVLLTITSPDNHKNITSLQKQHRLLTDPERSSSVDVSEIPSVFYLGCSIHGNESSGSNAALLIAYHLAAAKGKEIENILQNIIVLLDPSLNPDGLDRFATWVNSRKNMIPSPDSDDVEHHEPWPTGRSNHYWFDLNRDWLVAQQPESKARLKVFHEWKPNLLTDHHEMQTDATFFFQPGVPSRQNPLTPAANVLLTQKIGTYHAKALDEIGSLYYTKENFDDFFIGKGSTFPDVQGGIGILFEQASARGHAQESINGVVRFEFAIRNQFVTALSSLRAASDLRVELLEYQRQFFKDASTAATKDPIKSYAFGLQKDKQRGYALTKILQQHDISVYRPQRALTISGKNYAPEDAFIVPLNQYQHKLIKGIFETRTNFSDSIFYDISTWTLSHAMGVDVEALRNVPPLGKIIDNDASYVATFKSPNSTYAYAFETFSSNAHRAINRLLEAGIQLKISTTSFNHPSGKVFSQGSVLIPISTQERTKEVVEYFLHQVVQEDGIDVFCFDGGLDYSGVSLGSGSFKLLRKPRIALLVDEGVSSLEAGEIWHLLDQQKIPLSKISSTRFNSLNIGKYNTIILPKGSYGSINEAGKQKLRAWIENGGTVVGTETALQWLNNNGLARFEIKKMSAKNDSSQFLAYNQIGFHEGSKNPAGVILSANADLSHPLLFGFENSVIPVFKNNYLAMEKSKNAFANPLTLGSSPLISGYIRKQQYELSKSTSLVGVSALGKGRVIGFTDNLAFRGFWLGTNKLLLNALFFGDIIDADASR